jgi:hypothetical protein
MDRTRKHKHKNRKHKTKKLLRGGDIPKAQKVEAPHFKQRKTILTESSHKRIIGNIATQKKTLVLPSLKKLNYYTNSSGIHYIKQNGVLKTSKNIQNKIKVALMSNNEILQKALLIRHPMPHPNNGKYTPMNSRYEEAIQFGRAKAKANAEANAEATQGPVVNRASKPNLAAALAAMAAAKLGSIAPIGNSSTNETPSSKSGNGFSSATGTSPAMLYG